MLSKWDFLIECFKLIEKARLVPITSPTFPLSVYVYLPFTPCFFILPQILAGGGRRVISGPQGPLTRRAGSAGTGHGSIAEGTGCERRVAAGASV